MDKLEQVKIDFFDYVIHSIVQVLFLIFLPISVYSQVELPLVFDDHMVMQRNTPIKIWGKASPTAEVIIEFHTEELSTMADSQGEWMVNFPAKSEGGPYQLKITSGNKVILIKDILIGELWLCSGQSNMQFALKNSSQGNKDISEAKNSHIRMFRMDQRLNLGPSKFTESEMKWLKEGDFMNIRSWEKCNPESAANFSAVAYYFGKKLYDSLNVPIGLIQNAIGGSTIESWIDINEVDSLPQYSYLKSDLWYNHYRVHPWVKKRVFQNLQPILNTGEKRVSHIHPFSPGYLFDCGIKPISPLPIRGVIWYQGESNATDPETYPKLFKLMKKSWETAFNQLDIPFLFVQLPRIGNRSRWPEFRAQQEKCLELSNTGMVVSIDEGDLFDVHPKQKKIIGDRLAKLALFKIYGFEINATSPTFESYIWDHSKRKIEIEFNWAEKGLKTKNNEFPTGFSLNGYNTDGKIEIVLIPDEIKILGSKVIIIYPEKFIPIIVSYAWAPFPDNNIINDNDLPLTPFRIDLQGNN